ncbi:maleylacetate reductase [Roseomonas hellenica]|uniref:Maleylacetate reductase n=1 Tax=Plastoroseomonas hellenica TaxID=2687306 RepID=A0ABS5ES01_9PROT|nr:maleylacetate reductase [Plastoroseomonas hellenica]
MIAPFAYTALPARVLFGPGRAAELGAELAALGGCRALVLSTAGQRGMAARVAAPLGDALGAHFDGAVMHTPVAVTERALAFLHDAACDAIVAIGGGSTIGLGKALALRTGLPQIAVPTTYAGSEVTPVLGQTEGGRKTTLRSLDVLPEVVIYDPELTLSLPPAISATSGLNALAHAVEALYARDANPITSLMAEEGIRALGAALPAVVADGSDHQARARAQYGAWLCATCLGAVGMALHHKICHALGGAFGLPHAETHAVLIPHVAGYNAGAAPDAMARVARALGGTDDAAAALWRLAGTLGAPRALRDIGMPEDGIGRAVALVLEGAYWNPRPPDAASLEALLRRAWAGAPPAVE